ncbi:MAG: hypothetical protein WCH21_03500, partial [Bacteroidota bacterium]
IDMLVKALGSANVSKSLHLLVVGEQDDTVKPLFESVEIKDLIKNKRIYIKNQFVNINASFTDNSNCFFNFI